ncbi:putative para-nitrobenzyl esterase [Pillotina sp. SPG140]
MIKLFGILTTMAVMISACGTNAGMVGSGQGEAAETLVKTRAGAVHGYVSNGIYTYHGIPYAQATERFVPAEDVTPWEGVLDATAYGPISLQAGLGFAAYSDGSGATIMDNNCQNLNIWTPGTGGGQKRPVMVWLHGGGFSSGASSTDAATDGENLSRYGDVVVVSVNHRLNILGHFDLSEYGDKYQYSANVGITDIADALQWIQDNIGQFGGDPGNVTVFGESGGGAKVLALMTTPYAEGLFHKGIVQSGTTETVGLQLNSKAVARRVTELTLEKLGITAETIEDLQRVDYEELTRQSNLALQQAAEEFGIPGPFGGFSMEWQPVVDGGYMPTNAVTDDSFAEAGKDIPLLIGTNLNEWEAFGLLMNMNESQHDNKTIWSEEEVNAKLEEKYVDRAEEIANAFMEAYPYKTKADVLYVDTMIRLPSLKIMSHKADQRGAPVYAYMFTWESPAAPGLILANHTAEIPFVFHNIERSAMTIGDSEEAYTLEERMSRAWINFAKTGNPNTDDLPEWPAFDREGGAVMLFDNEPMAGYKHDRKLLSLLAPEYEY